MTVYLAKSGNYYYIRTPLSNTYDLVWRKRVGLGVFDGIDVRRISRATLAANTLVGYNQNAAFALKSGVDENPGLIINGGTVVGGNHTAALNYSMTTLLDKKPFVPAARPVTFYAGNLIEIEEHFNGAGFVHIVNKWAYDNSPYVRWSQEATALIAFQLDVMLGTMSQKLIIPAGGGYSLHMKVPRTSMASGVDVTNDSSVLPFAVNTWDDSTKPPEEYTQEMKLSGSMIYGFTTAYKTGMYRGNLSADAGYRNGPTGKVYPTAIANLAVAKGQHLMAEGSFGFYSSI